MNSLMSPLTQEDSLILDLYFDELPTVRGS